MSAPNEPTDPTRPPGRRVIDLSVEVVGTPEQVWEAIATGPGISSWYVPTMVEPHEGGATTSRFGDGPGMTIPGVVSAWEPPHRVEFGSAGDDAGLAFEWLVEARDGGTCIVRLVNSGFDGEQWDDQYDGMAEGWLLFLSNLQLHCAHFAGEAGSSMLPMAMWRGPRVDAWRRLIDAIGVPEGVAVGDRVVAGGSTPPFAGTVVTVAPYRLALVLDEPARGTAFVAAEGGGEQVGVSVWSYLYGDDRDTVVARDEPRWNAWLAALA
jgi:uncharacterized protein YndB with AHSA1/START domain